MADKKKGKERGAPEIFKIEKKGSEKSEVKEAYAKESSEKPEKEQVKRENQQLRTIFIVIGVVVLVFIALLIINSSLTHFEYRNVKYKIVRYGNLIFYNTYYDLYSDAGKKVNKYNFYIRNDPRKLEDEVSYVGEELELKSNLAVKYVNNSFNCEGDGAIAVANFVSLNKFFGIEVINDQSATCDFLGRYSYVQFQEGNKTKITSFGPSCFLIEIKDCEILEGTERFMTEVFAVTNENRT